MKSAAVIAGILSFILLMGCSAQQKTTEGWISLFNGKNLDGWKASENQGTFTVKDGMIAAHGKRSHLFYVGPVENANFKDFEFKADVMTTPGSNSGIYFHTEYQETGWPKKGYESQINNSHSDWKRTCGLYDVVNIKDAPAQDNEWFTQHIIVQGKHIIVKTDDKVIVDYTEPDSVYHEGWPGRKLSSGTFALQGHDPKSIVYYKNIMVR